MNTYLVGLERVWFFSKTGRLSLRSGAMLSSMGAHALTQNTNSVSINKFLPYINKRISCKSIDNTPPPLRSALASPLSVSSSGHGQVGGLCKPNRWRTHGAYTVVNKTAMRDFFISPKVESRLGSKRRLEYVVSACDAGAELQTRIDVLLALPPTRTVRAAMGVRRPCRS